VEKNLRKKGKNTTPYSEKEPVGNKQPSLIFVTCEIKKKLKERYAHTGTHVVGTSKLSAKMTVLAKLNYQPLC